MQVRNVRIMSGSDSLIDSDCFLLDDIHLELFNYIIWKAVAKCRKHLELEKLIWSE
jgi:hypothetical protein